MPAPNDLGIRRRAYLGMGSNMGDSRQFLRDAVAALDEVTAVSPLYETDPVGGPEQEVFLNIVVELMTQHEPYELLRVCQELESAAQRVRQIRWGPRTLDVDVVWVEGVEMDTEELTIPHPRAHQRNFVMRPLLDLDPDLVLPGYDPAGAFGDVRRLGPL